MDLRKRAVSLRLGTADLRRIKRAAERLGLRDSDLIRYAIKSLLGRLSPLTDPNMQGKSLVPMFLESAPDLVHHFDLDVTRLDAILNAGTGATDRVPPEDLHLIAMTAAQNTISRPVPSAPLMAARSTANGSVKTESASGATPHTSRPNVERRVSPSRRYLYDKYLYKQEKLPTPGSES